MDNIQSIARFLGIEEFSSSIAKTTVITIDEMFHNAVYRLSESALHYDDISIIVHEKVAVTIKISSDYSPQLYKKIICIVRDYAQVNLLIEQPQNYRAILFCKGRIKTGASLHISARFPLTGDQKVGIVVHQIHEGKGSSSSCTLKGVLADESRWWCENMIIIQHDATQSVAEQKTYALLVSDKARFCGAPSLEVLNQEVQCKHGSAVGYVNDEHRFYMMSRGLSYNHAEKLMIEGFLA